MEEKEIGSKKKKYGIGIIIAIGLMVTLYLSTILVSRVMVTFTKAAPSSKVSLQNSYILGNKLLATADGRDKATVNVFVLDKDGKGIAGKNVSLSGAENIIPEYGITDNEGKVVFGIMSAEEKQYVISALVEGLSMGKEITVTFRN